MRLPARRTPNSTGIRLGGSASQDLGLEHDERLSMSAAPITRMHKAGPRPFLPVERPGDWLVRPCRDVARQTGALGNRILQHANPVPAATSPGSESENSCLEAPRVS